MNRATGEPGPESSCHRLQDFSPGPGDVERSDPGPPRGGMPSTLVPGRGSTSRSRIRALIALDMTFDKTGPLRMGSREVRIEGHGDRWLVWVSRVGPPDQRGSGWSAYALGAWGTTVLAVEKARKLPLNVARLPVSDGRARRVR